MNTTAIEIDDTVRVTGWKRNAIVTDILANGRVEVEQTTGNARRGGLRTTISTVDADRVTLVRKGNRTDDIANAMIARVDAVEAHRNGTGTVDEFDATRDYLGELLGC